MKTIVIKKKDGSGVVCRGKIEALIMTIEETILDFRTCKAKGGSIRIEMNITPDHAIGEVNVNSLMQRNIK